MVSFCSRHQASIGDDESNLPRCNCKSLTSSVSPPLCFASRHPKWVTESINSSAICKSNCSGGEMKKRRQDTGQAYVHLRPRDQSVHSDRCSSQGPVSTAACSDRPAYSSASRDHHQAKAHPRRRPWRPATASLSSHMNPRPTQCAHRLT